MQLEVLQGLYESQRVGLLALLVQGNWGIEMLHRNLLVMERTYISLLLSV